MLDPSPSSSSTTAEAEAEAKRFQQKSAHHHLRSRKTIASTGEIELPAWHNVVAGGIAGAGSRICTAPLDLIRIRRQLTPPENTGGSVLGTWRSVVRNEGGIAALFRGNVAAIYLWVGYSAVQFALYNQLHVIVQDRWTAAADPETGLEIDQYPAASAFCAGAGAGLCATVSTYPFDVCRTALAARGMFEQQQQQQPCPADAAKTTTTTTKAKASAAAATTTKAAAGRRRRTAAPPMPFSSLIEPNFREHRGIIMPPPPPPPQLPSASATEANARAAAAIPSPAFSDTIKTTTADPSAATARAAAATATGKTTRTHQQQHPRTVTEFAAFLYRRRGLPGFYAGAGPAVLQIVPYMGLNFCIYDALTRDDHRVGLSAYAGSIAGAVSKILVYPVDTIKRRLQGQVFFAYPPPQQPPQQPPPPPPPSSSSSSPFVLVGQQQQHQRQPYYTGMVDCAARIYREEGMKSFYRGVGPSVLKTTISTGLTFALFRFTKNTLETIHHTGKF